MILKVLKIGQKGNQWKGGHAQTSTCFVFTHFLAMLTLPLLNTEKGRCTEHNFLKNVMFCLLKAFPYKTVCKMGFLWSCIQKMYLNVHWILPSQSFCTIIKNMNTSYLQNYGCYSSLIIMRVEAFSVGMPCIWAEIRLEILLFFITMWLLLLFKESKGQRISEEWSYTKRIRSGGVGEGKDPHRDNKASWIFPWKWGNVVSITWRSKYTSRCYSLKIVRYDLWQESCNLLKVSVALHFCKPTNFVKYECSCEDVNFRKKYMLSFCISRNRKPAVL